MGDGDLLGTLAQRLAKYSLDPLGWVRFAFDWGHGELAAFAGPDQWQTELLTSIGEKLRKGEAFWPIFEATGSGHGIGKSAVVSWLILWAISTYPDTRGVVTAETDTQLRTKTWSELAKWHRLSLIRELFTLTATSIFSSDSHHEKTWRIDAIPWNRTRPEAFAGLHNLGKRLLLLFDEASNIDDIIWDTAEGALTDGGTQIIWAAFGNRTRSEGRFHRCFSSNRWTSRCIDSRTVKVSNKRLINNWIEEYGIDSDFVKVRVLGEAPRVGDVNFIARDVVVAANRRDIPDSQVYHYPLVFGVDVARYGSDATIITARRGPKQVLLKKYRGLDTMAVSNLAVEHHRNLGSTGTICVDGIGIGAGVVDRLRQLRLNVVDVNVGTESSKPREYGNLRAELYGRLKDWLPGASLIEDDEQTAQLTCMQYGYNGRMQLMIEKKDDMRRRGLPSPDCADAIGLTFAAEAAYAPRSAKVIQFQSRKIVW